MSRFFTEPSNIDDKLITITNKGDIHHLAKVLRLRVGDEVDVSDGNQWEYRAKIIEMPEGGDTNGAVILSILDKQKFAREPELKVTLFQGIPKAGKMETIIQKSVELGVNSIVPVFMDRTVVVEKGNFGKKLERWQKIADEAVKQCKRGIIPQITESIKSSQMMGMFDDFDLVLFPYENEENYSIKDCLTEFTRPRCEENENMTGKEIPKTVAIIIGPEGGFSEKEATAIEAAGGKTVTLGKTILRTETAGITALAMTMYELEL